MKTLPLKNNTLSEYKKAKRSSDRKETALSWLFLSPYALHYVVFSMVPLAMGLVFSFCKFNPYDSSYTEFTGFHNYALVFQNNIYSQYFWGSFKKVLLYDLVAVPCSIIIPLALAYLINLQPPGHKIFRAILYVPSVISISIVGILFSSIFSSDPNGLFNATFNTNINFLNDPENEVLRWFIILLASIWATSGANFVIYLAALRDVPKSLYEACDIDGGGKWEAFRRVTLPSIFPILELSLFSSLIGNLSLYNQPLVLQGVLFASNYDTPMIFLQKMINDITKANLMGLLTAFAVVFGIIIMICTGIEKLIVKDRREGRDKDVKRYKAFIEKQKT